MAGNHITALRKFVSPEMIWGIDARLMIAQYISNLESERPMIVTDCGITRQPWFADIINSVETRTKQYVIFDKVTPNPKDNEAMAGTALFVENKCDLLIAVGGGSPMDCAKCISIVSTNGGHILDYEGVDKVYEPGPPLICIPSTAGSSADVSQFAIILDTESKLKKAIISKKVVPDLALIDPVPLLTVDSYLAACTGMDALTHAIEAYVSTAHSDLTDTRALEAIHLLSENLENAILSGATIDTIYPVMLGSLQAGLAFSNASLGAVHAMSHSLGGILDLPHGECNSILLAHIIEKNFDWAADRYTTAAKAMGLNTIGCSSIEVKNMLVKRLSDMRHKIGIRDRIQVENYKDFEHAIIDSALCDPCMVTNPKQLSYEEVRDIYGEIITIR